MTFLPVTLTGKAVAAVWAVACAGVLAFAYVGRDIRATDIVVLLALLALSFPISLALSALLTGIFYLLDTWFGVVVPGGLGFNIIAWILFVAAGYMQWRVMVPHVFARKENVI